MEKMQGKQSSNCSNAPLCKLELFIVFVCDILVELNMLGSEKAVYDWFNMFKKGFYDD